MIMKTTHVLGQKTEKTKDRNMKINLLAFIRSSSDRTGGLNSVGESDGGRKDSFALELH